LRFQGGMLDELASMLDTRASGPAAQRVAALALADIASHDDPDVAAAAAQVGSPRPSQPRRCGQGAGAGLKLAACQGRQT
jgi:hypothetical protein